jgi:hypothetical protein
VDADLGRQARHLGDAAGVVGHRPVGVEAHHQPGQRQHGRGGDADAVDAGGEVGGEDAGADHDDRQGGGLHRDARPWMMFVPCPVVDALAMLSTGRWLMPV